MTAPRASLARRIAFAVLPLLVLVAGVEIAARVYGNRLSRSRGVSFGVDAELPARGKGTFYRGNELRIAAVGDSWTFGLFVDPSQAWPEVVQARLTQSGVDNTVVNLGQPGASPVRVNQALATFFATNHPDLVIYLAGENPTPPSSAGVAYRAGVFATAEHLLEGLASVRLLEQVVARGQARRDAILQNVVRGPSREMTELKRWDVRRRDVSSNLHRADLLTTAAGAHLLVLTYPVPHEIADPALIGRQCDVDPLDAIIREEAVAQGLDLLDLEKAFDAPGLGLDALAAGPAVVHAPASDAHPNATGYAEMARRIAERVAQVRRAMKR
jgi:lysophospholipase L1-like esterase